MECDTFEKLVTRIVQNAEPCESFIPATPYPKIRKKVQVTGLKGPRK
jgi:hypothetical protein